MTRASSAPAASAFDPLPIRDSANGASFSVRVQPRARKTAITGILGSGDNAAVKLALCAPPIDGRANDALVDFFSELFDVPHFAVQVLAGTQSRNKVVRIEGRTAAELRVTLAPLLPS
jgi:uncharacterized protein